MCIATHNSPRYDHFVVLTYSVTVLFLIDFAVIVPIILVAYPASAAGMGGVWIRD
jgi:hypothetical protein